VSVDLWDNVNRIIAIIGKDITSTAIGQLPPGASCGPDEKIVLIPRKTLVAAKADIPENH